MMTFDLCLAKKRTLTSLCQRKSFSADDQNFAIEGYYDFQVTDNIKITPAVFWVDQASGQEQVKGQNKLGGLVKTTFKF